MFPGWMTNLLWVVLLLLCCGNPHVVVAAKDDKEGTTAATETTTTTESWIIDATALVEASTESKYDHMVVLEDNLSFHWNDIADGEKLDEFMGRLIHKADSIEQAPSWLGFGVYHSNHNYVALPTQDFMIGSTALIGMPSAEQAETATPALHYHLGAKMVDGIEQVNDNEGSYINSEIFQHDADDGTVTTELSFVKPFQEAAAVNPEGTLRKVGTNVFLWAVGPPGTPGRLGQHALKGVIYLDLDAVEKGIKVGSTTGTPAATAETTPPQDATVSPGGETTSATDTTTPPASTTNSTTPTTTDPSTTTGTSTTSTAVNTAPVISGQCGSTIFALGDAAGFIALTPMLAFHWDIVDNQIQMALEYEGREEVWLSVALSTNGQMIGSSAVIGIPNSKVQHYILAEKNVAAMIPDTNIKLQDASIFSAPSPNDPLMTTTTLQVTKSLNDPADPIPISAGLTTFLYAVGASSTLAYHEHRGAFRLNLEECGGKINVASSSSTGSSSSEQWSNRGTFVAHGFLATLAWGLATPFAITVAWFRTLVPAAWIYIHVFANVFTFLASLIAFSIAIAGVNKQEGAAHFSDPHHWVGLVLFFLATFQVVNGFLRPPVERKESNRPLAPQEFILGIIPIPRTPRETWHLMHHMGGLVAVLMGVYQIQSGLAMYSERFHTKSMVTFYWIYVALFVCCLIGLKIWVHIEEDKARRGLMQMVNTSEPTMEETDNNNNNINHHNYDDDAAMAANDPPQPVGELS